MGFIRDLPHTLVAAFRATLEETVQADILLHVIDASAPNWNEQADQVNKTLKDIGADSIPQIQILNKSDLMVSLIAAGTKYVRDEYGRMNRICISAKTGDGLDFLRRALAESILEHSKKMDRESAVGTKEIIEVHASMQ